MKENDLQRIFSQAAAELNAPAGDQPEFASLEAIQKNQEFFIKNVHQTLKKWHHLSIKEILTFDEIARAEIKQPIEMSDWIEYCQTVWRRLNDAIVWILCGMQRHQVKRLCFYRPRTYLSESNPKSILNYLDSLNADPLTMAVWNDATSCADIGDISISRPMTSGLEFIEVKQGKVNEAISEILSNIEKKESETELDNFTSLYGPKGLKQLKRCQNQMMLSKQALALLNFDKGVDPVTGIETQVAEVQGRDEYWHEDFNRVLHESLEKKSEVLHVIDECLYIYANGNPDLNFAEVRDHFIELIKKREPRLTSSIKRNDLGRPVSLEEGLFQPVSLPIFLRPIDSELIGEVLYGRLFKRVLFYFDWSAFSKRIEEVGGIFGWAGSKEAGRELSKPWALRPIKVFGRLPKIQFGEVTLYITGASMNQLFFDGITPKEMAYLQEGGARAMEKVAKESGKIKS